MLFQAPPLNTTIPQPNAAEVEAQVAAMTAAQAAGGYSVQVGADGQSYYLPMHMVSYLQPGQLPQGQSMDEAQRQMQELLQSQGGIQQLAQLGLLAAAPAPDGADGMQQGGGGEAGGEGDAAAAQAAANAASIAAQQHAMAEAHAAHAAAMAAAAMQADADMHGGCPLVARPVFAAAACLVCH